MHASTETMAGRLAACGEQTRDLREYLNLLLVHPAQRAEAAAAAAALGAPAAAHIGDRGAGADVSRASAAAARMILCFSQMVLSCIERRNCQACGLAS